MLGALIGDYVGSPYEFDCNNIKTEEFPFFGPRCRFTDDSVLTIAVAEALMNAVECGTSAQEKCDARAQAECDASVQVECVRSLQKWGRAYPDAGYGARFWHWLWDSNPQPYGSWGNGSAMRVSAAGWLFDSLKQTEHVAWLTAAVSHNHEEGVRGAQATAAAIFLARTGAAKAQIKQVIEGRYGYDLSGSLAQIRPTYRHVESCQETVPVALIAFLESRGFEDAVRKAVSVGGDSDTIACITGSIAEAYYGIPPEMQAFILGELPDDLAAVIRRWHARLEEPPRQAGVQAGMQAGAAASAAEPQRQAPELWAAGLMYQANRTLAGKDPNPPKAITATARDWDIEPMPEATCSFTLNTRLSASEFETLAMGHIPQEMEDKWFMYYEPSDSTLRFHRSWTGFCIFAVHLAKDGTGYVADTVTANQDPRQYANDSVESMRALVSALIAQDVGRDTPAL